MTPMPSSLIKEDSYAFVSHQRRDRDEGVKPPLLVPAVWVWQLRVYGSIVGAACLLAQSSLPLGKGRSVYVVL